MKAFFKGFELQRRENMVKDSLTSQLMASIKGVQLDHAQNEYLPQKNNEATNALCTILEAIFLHGLKETLASRVSMAIADPDQRPTPDFWSPLMVFSHRDIIKQISKMSQITNDVGRCRAWVRLALNDNLFLSYFDSLLQQNSALVPYYKKTAFLRDSERLNVAKSFIEGLSSLSFDLPTNSSILNVWTNIPLLLAGIWTAPLKSCPVFTGTDVAKTILDDVSGEDTVSLMSLSSLQESGSHKFHLDENEALKIILGTPMEGSPLQSRTNLDQIETKLPEPLTDNLKNIVEKLEENEFKFDKDISVGVPSNSKETVLSVDSKPCSDDNKDNKPLIGTTLQKVSDTTENVLKSPTTNVESYHSLLKSYSPAASINYKSSDLEDFIQRLESFPTATSSSGSSDKDDEQITMLGFEVVSESSSFSIAAPECRKLIETLGKIVQEPGLNSQNYLCKKCDQLIGVSFKEAKVCGLTGYYYCTDCFLSTEWIIPARILHNWDFSRYEVCNKAAVFLNEVQYHPILDIRRINPRLYLFIEDMEILRKLRMQLNFLRSYLMTCREPVLKKIQKQVWPREYLYEHVHLYSISDLVEISSGSLTQFLTKIIKMCQDHVISCCLCSQKGFICEICKDPKAIYPFQLDTSYRCSICKSVFHSACRIKVELCPKCKRIKERRANLEAECDFAVNETQYD